MNYEYDGLICKSMEEVYDYAIDKHLDDQDEDFKISLRLDDDTDTSEVKAAFEFTERIGNMLLVVEESSIYFDRWHPIPAFRRLVSQGRHFNVSLICVSQRVPELDTTFRAQANSLITFLQTSPTDLEGLHQWGFDEEEVRVLEKFDRRYTVPMLGVNYLCEGDALSSYGIRAIERDTDKPESEEQDETPREENLQQRQEVRPSDSEGV
jgi:hypothetical protein